MSRSPNIINTNELTQTQVSKLTQEGIALHQQGNFSEAQVIYEQILMGKPDHFDALQLLGVLFAQVKKYSQSVEFLSKALEINPNHAGAFSNRGIALKELKQFDEALASYDQAIAVKPDYLDAYSNRGNLLMELSRFDEALASYDQAIKINPDYAESYGYRGITLKKLKQFDEALASYDQAIAVKPDYLDAYSNRGNLLMELSRFDEALASYDQAIKINPDYAESYGYRGITLKKLKQFDEALASYDQAIAVKPDYLDAYSNRGNLLMELSRFDEALASYDQAIKINPDYAEAYHNRGTILQELRQFDEALASYGQAIKINPNYADAHWNAAICNFIKGNFKTGWIEYEWRWKHFECDSERLNTNRPIWDYKKTEQRLLVWAEQGIGDHILFGGLFSELLEDVPNLLVQIDQRLIPIFIRSFPKIKFYPSKNLAPNSNSKIPESDYDIHLPIGSLGKYLRNDKKDFLPTRNTYLKDDELKTARIKKDLIALASSNNKLCGISWKSKSTFTGHQKSTTLKYFIKTLDLEGYTFVSLQYGKTKDEIKEVRNELGVNIISYEEVDNFLDIDGLSSLIQACDKVITVDNITSQLAGALGKQTHILLTFNPWWCWMLERNDSPWHPSIKLYRQDKINDWDSAFKKLKADL